MIRRDHRAAAALVRQLKRAHADPDSDVLTRCAIAEQLRVAAQAEAALRALQLEQCGAKAEATTAAILSRFQRPTPAVRP